ncbi:hypothetical protein B9Z19DRAFT_1094199 [Tuber borchii]|uniref:C2H2-type domain-containing protein n=1 Tax=Tuber borchii TaxID=42251 RepID=A0A2T6ZEH5_TUBBO|nr:hypothetical protein B9Z19DRAFT_1094199 [Tuber borchii]
MAEAVEPLPSPPDTSPIATSASARTALSSPNTTQRDRVDIASSPSSSRAAPPIPTFASLAQSFRDPSELNSHLLSLSKAELAAIIVSEAGKSSTTTTTTKSPTPESKKYAHCVYCHEIFDKEHNVGCQVMHYGEIEEIDDDISQLTCCGLSLDYTDFDSNIGMPPEEEEPYCYEGGHWDRFIDQDDDEEGTWWQEWGNSGRTCKDIGCQGMVNPKKRRYKYS